VKWAKILDSLMYDECWRRIYGNNRSEYVWGGNWIAMEEEVWNSPDASVRKGSGGIERVS